MGSAIRSQINSRDSNRLTDTGNGFVRIYLKKIKFYIKQKKRIILKSLVYPQKNIRSLLNDKVFEKETFDILFLSVTSTRILIGDKWFDQQSDPFLLHLQNTSAKSLVLERDNGIGFKSPIYFENNTFNLDHYIESKIAGNSFLKNTGKFNLEDYQKFLSIVTDCFGDYQLSYLLKKENLNIQLQKLSYFSGLLKNIIRKSGVKICFVTNYDTYIGMAMCNACRELNIPSVDLQHGSQGDFHHGYGVWSKLPEKGFSTLPSIYWNWNQFEVEQIKQWSSNNIGHKSLKGGNPWVSLWDYKENVLMKHFSEHDNNFKKSSKEIVHVLFTMQANITDNLPDNIINAINKSPANWIWWVRLHPRQLKDRLKIIKRMKRVVNIDDSKINIASELPLPLLLENMDIHITKSSSTVIDAELFNVPSIVTRLVAKDFYKNQIENGIAVYCDEKTDSLISSIKKLLCNNSSNLERVDAFVKFDELMNEFNII